MCHTYLVEKGLQSLTPAEAREAAGGGAVLLDVRLRDSYNDEHAAGALNAPLFRDIEGGREGTAGFFDQVKKIAMGGFAMVREGLTTSRRNPRPGARTRPRDLPGRARDLTACVLAAAQRATERNPNFVEDVGAAVGGRDAEIIVMCSIGGTLDTFIRRPNRKPYADPDRCVQAPTAS